MSDFSIIQGDDKSIIVEFTGAVSQEIVGFYFSSKRLGVSKYFGEKIEDKWIISFASEETRNFPDGIASFDITAKKYPLHLSVQGDFSFNYGFRSAEPYLKRFLKKSPIFLESHSRTYQDWKRKSSVH